MIAGLMMSDYYFCPQCNKVVPASDTKEMEITTTVEFAKKWGGTPGIHKIRFHNYFSHENHYKNQPPGVIGYCPVGQTSCAKVRELSEQELYIYKLTGG